MTDHQREVIRVVVADDHALVRGGFRMILEAQPDLEVVGEAGANLKILQDLLGHSSIVVTADTYTSVLPLSQRRTADATADLVLAAARRTRTSIRRKALRNRPRPRSAAGASALMTPWTHEKVRLTAPQPVTSSRSVIAPGRHPRDTHRPHRTSTLE